MTDRRTIPVGETGRTVAASIRAHRRLLGWSAVRLAVEIDKLGCPIRNNGITKIERGTRRLSVDELAAFATALGIDPVQLFTVPTCDKCHGAPAPWTKCLACGAEARP